MSVRRICRALYFNIPQTPVGAPRAMSGAPIGSWCGVPLCRRPRSSLGNSVVKRAGRTLEDRRRCALRLAAAGLLLLDARFDHDVDGASGHDQVLDVVPTNEQKFAPAVDVRLIDNFKAFWWPRPKEIADERILDAAGR